MDLSSMYTFLSEENVSLHFEYYRNVMYKLSIYQKSIPEADLSSISSLVKSDLNKQLKMEILPYLNSALLHKAYFESFTSVFCSYPSVKKWYSSVESLLFEMYCEAKKDAKGFLCVFADKDGAPIFRVVDENVRLTLPDAFLAVDLSEHAYFYDYGFRRDDYLRAALSHLDFSRLFA